MPDSRELQDWHDRLNQAWGDDAVEPDEEVTQERQAREWVERQSGRPALPETKANRPNTREGK